MKRSCTFHNFKIHKTIKPEEKYRITAVAGNSAKRKFSRVFFGTEKAGGRKVVIKSLAGVGYNAVSRERLREESKFSFNIPELPVVLDFSETETEVFLILEMKEGISLMEFVKTLKRKEKAQFILKLLLKLEPVFGLLSNEHIVHLDIKPGNIIIDQKGDDFNVALIDFGMAMNLSHPEQRNTLFPLGYAAPELVLNRLHLADQRSDIYSLGITIWQIFTGKIPLLHPNPSITTNLQITHPLPEHDLIPDGYLQILRKMSAKHSFAKPADQYSPGECDEFLKRGLNERYAGLPEIIDEWKTEISKKRRWFGF